MMVADSDDLPPLTLDRPRIHKLLNNIKQELRAKRQAFEVHEREKRVCAIVSDVARCAIAKVLAAARDAERIEQARYQRLQRLYQVGQHLECEDAMYADVLFGSEM
jgi:hypothetical protein